MKKKYFVENQHTTEVYEASKPKLIADVRSALNISEAEAIEKIEAANIDAPLVIDVHEICWTEES